MGSKNLTLEAISRIFTSLTILIWHKGKAPLVSKRGTYFSIQLLSKLLMFFTENQFVLRARLAYNGLLELCMIIHWSSKLKNSPRRVQWRAEVRWAVHLQARRACRRGDLRAGCTLFRGWGWALSCGCACWTSCGGDDWRSWGDKNIGLAYMRLLEDTTGPSRKMTVVFFKGFSKNSNEHVSFLSNA